MSTFKIEVVKYTLEKHPDADSLSIAHIRGWDCVVKTSDFETNDPMYKDLNLGVYIPLDAVANADHPLLGFLEGKKVKARRLRGVFSQGVLLPLESVVKTYVMKKFPEEGDDLSSIMGIAKWEPSIAAESVKTKGECQEVPRPSWLSKYSDIENWNNYPTIIKEGERVHVSLKMHGTSAIFALIDGKYYICSRNRCLRTEELTIHIPKVVNKKIRSLLKFLRLDRLSLFSQKKVLPVPTSVWHRVFKEFELEKKLATIVALEAYKGNDYPAVAIYGEIVGVQDLMYGLKPGDLDFYVYDVRVEGSSIDNDYVNPFYLDALCKDLGLKTAPVLYMGSFEPTLLDLCNGKDPVGKTHAREGIVIKSIDNPYHKSLGRVILKKVGENFLLRKNSKDETDSSIS